MPAFCYGYVTQRSAREANHLSVPTHDVASSLGGCPRSLAQYTQMAGRVIFKTCDNAVNFKS